MITERFYKSGYSYELIKIGKKSLLYKQCKNGIIYAYELHKIRIRKVRIINGTLLKETNRLPSNEDFGKWAWSCLSYQRAIIKFFELENA